MPKKGEFKDLKSRFDRFYIVCPSGCWLWTGVINKSGYGTISCSQFKETLAHRVSWIIHFGNFNKDLEVCHKCDVRNCVSPYHLFLGTKEDNQRDSVFKGRHWSQKKTHCPKGHEYTEESTYFRKDRNHRDCRTCMKNREMNRSPRRKKSKLRDKVARKDSDNL